MNGPTDLPDEPFRWARFSLRTVLLATSLLGVAGGIASLHGERDDVLSTMLGGIALIWCLLCWRTVRLNSNWFNARMKFAPIWALDAVYVFACVGQFAWFAIALLGGVGLDTAGNDGHALTALQLLIVIAGMNLCISMALGALSYFSCSGDVSSVKSLLTGAAVCFIPLMFAVHYFLWGRGVIAAGLRVKRDCRTREDARE